MDTQTKHKNECKRVFNNYDMSCSRCQELAEGAKPREGWQTTYYETKRRNEEMRSNARKNHNCQTANCSVVCTFGDW